MREREKANSLILLKSCSQWTVLEFVLVDKSVKVQHHEHTKTNMIIYQRSIYNILETKLYNYNNNYITKRLKRIFGRAAPLAFKINLCITQILKTYLYGTGC